MPRILVCHISNPHAKHADDEIYGVHFHHIYAGGVIMPHKSERIHLHGADKSDCFFLSDSIQWAESARGGKHSVVHTPGEAVEVRAPIAALPCELPGQPPLRPQRQAISRDHDRRDGAPHTREKVHGLSQAARREAVHIRRGARSPPRVCGAAIWR